MAGKMPMKGKGKPMHRMENGKPMSDAEHKKMYGEMHPDAAKKPAAKKGKK